MKPCIILFEVGKFDRTEAEHIESNIYDSFEEIESKGTTCYNMSDFMDLCNNQELDLENYWISYVFVNSIKTT